ncbi:tetraspanin-8 [Eleutherodactylus coqui]|uniref:tetraspanin-8 n=1 Tax=Eleutherodactylus coqui TaxID=57060 RepID=UPI003461C248
MAGVSSCLKYSMFIFNFLFWLCGCIILGISIWIRVSSSAQSHLNIQEGLLYAVDVMIAVGAIIMVLGFFGCCGAMRESRCLLLLFFIGLFLILALQITAGVLGAVYKPEMEAKLNETLQKQGPLHQLSEDLKKLVEKFQEENECCGFLNGINDWKGGSIPNSCKCSQTDPGKCTNNYYTQSCYSALLEFYKKYFAIIIGIAFGLAVIEIFGLIFSMVLYCQIGKI